MMRGFLGMIECVKSPGSYSQSADVKWTNSRAACAGYSGYGHTTNTSYPACVLGLGDAAATTVYLEDVYAKQLSWEEWFSWEGATV